MTEQDLAKYPMKMPDPAKLADAWTNVLSKGVEAIRAASRAERPNRVRAIRRDTFRH